MAMPANIATRVKLLGSGSELQEAEARLETAAAVIGIGLGFVDPENIPVARELAERAEFLWSESAAGNPLPSRFPSSIDPFDYKRVHISDYSKNFISSSES